MREPRSPKDLISLQEPIESPVFIGRPGNENFTSNELPTAIPPDKAAMRMEIESLTAGHAVTICPPGRYPTGLSAWKPVSKPANDNRELQSWPLAEALRRAGRESDIEVCEVYRGLWSVMAADPLQGRDPDMAADDDEVPEVRTESRSTINGKEAFDKFGIVTGTGEIDYKGVRQLARTPGASRMATHKGDGAAGDRYQVSTARFNETTLITQIDMRGAWARLRAAIRPLLAAFEDACLDGITLTEIGEARDFKDKQASAAGRALVFEAIGALSEEWVAICREARELEQQADRNVVRFRAKRERAINTSLGIAA